MSLWSLSQWLEHLGAIHPKNIDMGLDRITQVYHKLALDFSQQTIITVAGTNGKGTTCCLIEHAALLSGKTVAVYSSPHLLDYRERVRINGEMLSEQAHCQAFLQIEQLRGDIPLTYFEYSTLAGLLLIAQQHSQVVLLEVGLGGRLDAVNIVDGDIAVITSIDLDHQEWLGDTREKIALEKAGILRKAVPAVIGEPDPPQTLVSAVEQLTQSAFWQGKEFVARLEGSSWQWQSGDRVTMSLPLPGIPLQNASTALKVIELLNLPLTEQQLAQAVGEAKLAGRHQVIQTNPQVMLDVAHNPHATRLLASVVKAKHYSQLHLVVGMLADKDIGDTLHSFVGFSAKWYLASLEVPRGACSASLLEALPQNSPSQCFDSVKLAYDAAINAARSEDLVVVFGSFHTVADILEVGTSS